MGKNAFLVFLVIFLFFNLSPGGKIEKIYAQQAYRDPFEPQLPQAPVEVEQEEPVVEARAEVLPPPIIIEGILQAAESSRVIIEGEVYKAGDTLKSFDAKIHKIEKGKVFILYQGKLFEMSVSRKNVGKWEEK